VSFIFGLSHLLIQVSDLDRSERFYQDILSLELVGRDLVAEEGPNSLLKTDKGHFLLLVQSSDVQPFRRNSSSIHHAFYVTPEQYRDLVRRWEAAGGTSSDSRAQYRAKGQYSFDVFDPDGHRFQIQSMDPTAWAPLKAGIGRVVCGNVADFVIGSVTHFKDGQFYLVRRAEGFLALNHWCTHMIGELRYRENYHDFHCPYHQATYNRRGESTSHPCLKKLAPLRLHPISIEANGEIVVDTDQMISRREYSPSQLAVPSASSAELAAQ
jgi:catechol 2,3-dioxygenase-like lactoylglutathione lyase family enzyme/nitrite reductase/ring-hydroxylating ferredoxin subunit